MGLHVHFVISVSHIFKALAVSNVIDDYDSVGILKLTISDGSESFMACSVPLNFRESMRTSLAL